MITAYLTGKTKYPGSPNDSGFIVLGWGYSDRKFFVFIGNFIVLTYVFIYAIILPVQLYCITFLSNKFDLSLSLSLSLVIIGFL